MPTAVAHYGHAHKIHNKYKSERKRTAYVEEIALEIGLSKRR
jgi:hypothetical protein